MKPLPIWRANPGVFAHVSWAAEKIMKEGPQLFEKGRGMGCPLEGLAFAVSLHPGAWARIARIGGDAPVVAVEFRRPALDYYRWLRKRWVQEVPELTRWGAENGWIEPERNFLVWHWGGEEPEKRAWRLREGDKDLRYYREQLELGEDADDPVISIKETPGWRFLPKLVDRVARYYSPNDACLEAELVNVWLQEEHPEIGMVWYSERLDPLELSAPRGAILPAHFHEVRPLRIMSIEEWEAGQ